MKLIIAIVQSDDADKLVNSMVKEKLSATKLSSKGGFLSKCSITILIGVNEDELDRALDIIKNTCESRKSVIVPNSFPQEMGLLSTTAVEVTIGGATVFVVDVEQFYKF